MIVIQIVLGALMTIIFLTASDKLAAAFVPEQVRQSSLTYVRISSVEALSSAMETVISSCTRSLGYPDVPLLISSTKFIINIMLDLLIISRFRVGFFTPTVNMQALIRLACDMASALFGLAYFMYIAFRLRRQSEQPVKVKVALKTHIRPSVYTFTESAIRNAIYLWLVSRIILLGENYATAWGVFNTIRWGLVMVPVQALEASTLTFVGHNWGKWRARVGTEIRRPKASKADIFGTALSYTQIYGLIIVIH
jgi:Na+-driven multidrug efflux pump